jgi:DNA-binding SARP family transcriptional activator
MGGGELHIDLFGRFRLLYKGKQVTTVDTPRLRELLAYLVLNRDSRQSRQHLAFLFWPDSSEKQAMSNLRNLLHLLRKALPEADQFLNVNSKTLQWNTEAPFTLDAAEFEEYAYKAEQIREAGDNSQKIATLKNAADLYNGSLLPECYEEWIEQDREHLKQTFSSVLQELVKLLEKKRHFDQAIHYAKKRVDHDPLDEGGWRCLMKLYAHNNNRARAVETYRECVEILQKELNIEPTPGTLQFYERLLTSFKDPAYTKPAEKESLQNEEWSLVGREEEWEYIQTYWKQALSGTTQFMLIEGDPGIGKSRLGLEFMHTIRRQGYSVAYSRCYKAVGSLSYGPVIDWLKEKSVRKHLDSLENVWLTELVRLLPDLLVDHPDLAHPGPVTEPLQQRKLFEAIARALTAGDKAQLFFLDDLQWCDGKTLEWISYLFHTNRSKKLMLLGSSRPVEAGSNEQVQQLLGDLRLQDRMESLSLKELNEKETTELASSVAERPIDEETASRIFRETEGHPLFVVEAVREGHWMNEELTQEIDNSTEEVERTVQPLPKKITEVISARFRQLSKHGRQLMEVAAVTGRESSFALLKQASELNEPDLIKALDELILHRIIRQHHSGSYDFTHDKLREVAYEEIGDARKSWLHQCIAGAIKEIYAGNAEALKGRLTWHQKRAGVPEQTASETKSFSWTSRLFQAFVVYLPVALLIFVASYGLTFWLGLPEWTISATVILLALGVLIVTATILVEGANRAPPSGEIMTFLRATADRLNAITGNRLRWPNLLHWSVVAFVGLAIVVAAYMGSRILGVGPFVTLLSAGTIEEEDRIVLADFATQTVDSTLAYTVTDAFRVDLEQSPAVNLVDRARVSSMLELMERALDDPLDYETAREVDQAVRGLVESAYRRANEVLEEHRDVLDRREGLARSFVYDCLVCMAGPIWLQVVRGVSPTRGSELGRFAASLLRRFFHRRPAALQLHRSK